MHEEVPGTHVAGDVLVEGVNIYGRDIRSIYVRRQIGMVFQQPNVLPTRSIFENVAIGVRLNGLAARSEVGEVVEQSLQQAALWARGERVGSRLCRTTIWRTAAAALHCADTRC